MGENAECAHCGVAAADLPYEDLGMTLAEASEFLFDDGLCQGCSALNSPSGATSEAEAR